MTSRQCFTGRLGIISNVTERIKDETLVKVSLHKLEKTIQAMIYSMGRIVETRESYTARHQQCVAELARVISKWMGLTDEQVYYTHLSAVAHEIGKTIDFPYPIADIVVHTTSTSMAPVTPAASWPGASASSRASSPSPMWSRPWPTTAPYRAGPRSHASRDSIRQVHPL